MIVQMSASLSLRAARLVGNRDAGLAAGIATTDLVGVTIEATAPREFDQTGGSGAWFASDTTASLVASVLRGNRGVALVADKSKVQARGLVVLTTKEGVFKEVDIKGIFTGKTTSLADGILLNASPNSALDRCLLAGNGRAGILFESSPGAAVTRTLIDASQGQYGLVLQHTEDALDQANSIFGATQANRASDAGLSLPQAPEPLMKGDGAG